MLKRHLTSCAVGLLTHRAGGKTAGRATGQEEDDAEEGDSARRHVMMAKAFRIHPDDNVAVLLDDCAPGPVAVLGAGGVAETCATAAIKSGHKVALVGIGAGRPIVKYGQRIGHATQPIEPGQWVHLHNCASDYDERSATLDNRTGAPTDTRYE